MNPDDLRKAYRQRPDGTFEQISFRELKKGDTFRLEEPDGEPVDAGRIFIALSDALPPEARPPTFQADASAAGRWWIQV